MCKFVPSKSEVSSFCRGMYEMYNISKEVCPNLIIFPLRGAYPFYVSYKKISETKKEIMPDSLLLPLGTFNDLSLGRKNGLNKPEKFKIIKDNLDEYFTQNPNSRKVLLIDEVVGGGAISTIFKLTKKYLIQNHKDKEVKACAIESNKTPKCRKYLHRVKRDSFKRVKIDYLFTSDRDPYLPEVIKTEGFSIEVNKAKRLESILKNL